ncbi:MAG: efflux RND transporter periplasmic adaptor subunit [Planctomycetota bacterium]|jgi:multidrug efflux pump subunit AcrA (membrane-fusion protein)
MSDLPDEQPAGEPPSSDPGVPHSEPHSEPPPAPAGEAGTPPEGGRLTTREIVVAAIMTVVILVGGCGFFGFLLSLFSPPNKQAALASFTAVRVQTVVQADLEEMLTGYGRARAIRASDVAATVGGTVAWVAPECEAGAWVEQGAVLIKLDPRELAAGLDSAKARAAQTEAALARAKVDAASVAARLALATEELELAQTEYDRLKRLPEAVTKSQLDGQYMQVSLRRRNLLQLQRESDTSGPAVAAATAERDAANAALSRAQLDFDRAQVRAPFAGEIGARMVNEGQRVAPGAPLFQLTDATRVEVPIAIAAPVWTGTVARIAPRIDDIDRTFFVYAEVVTPPPAGGGRVTPVLAPGAFVVGDVEGPTHASAVAVPRSAFINDRAYVATPATIVAFVASDVSAGTPEARAAQNTQLKRIAEGLATLLAGVKGCGAVDPPAGSGIMKVSAAFTGTESWEVVTERARAAIRSGGLLEPDITITVGAEANVQERVPVVGRRLPEVALVRSGIAAGDLLVVTNLEQVAGGGRVRLVGDQSEQVSLPKPAAPAGTAAAPGAGDGD